MGESMERERKRIRETEKEGIIRVMGVKREKV